MASIGLIPPRLPDPPTEYDQQYMVDLIRAVELFITQETNPGEMRATKITLTAIPTSAVGLETGALYRVENQVKIVVANTAVPDGSEGTGAVGSVTVVIS